MGDCWDDRSKWEIYNEKIDKHAHSVQNSKVIRTCLARGKILENVGFFKVYIQVLMMVIITETLTSTSHHDIFTYLDYIFSCYLHTVGFYPYLLSYIYMYREREREKCHQSDQDFSLYVAMYARLSLSLSLSVCLSPSL